jgi:hypothetical protein
MKIVIDYEASWRNSFLDGDNNEPVPKGGRDFIGSMKNLTVAENFKVKVVTLDTVMGLMNRLIGDQRKLYQARQKFCASNYFFEDIEPLVTFEDKPLVTEEVVFLRNMKGSTDQNGFTGMIKMNDQLFTSDYSAELWGVLQLDLEALCQFILSSDAVIPAEVLAGVELDPLSICSKMIKYKSDKPLKNQGLVADTVLELRTQFTSTNYLNTKGLALPESMYCSALYLQQKRLSARFDTSSVLTKAEVISGISKKTFTKKDFMKKFTTSEGKKIFGNPYMKTELIKGQGSVRSMLSKASGQLEIRIDVDRQKGEQIKELIENAGVSSFYLGKKGLAYVSTIRI